MKKYFTCLTLLFTIYAGVVTAQKQFIYNTETSKGPLTVHVFGHASLLFEWNNLMIYVDPYSKVNDYSGMEKADIILVTHEHSDHFDSKAINQIKSDTTLMIYTKACNDAGIYTGTDTLMANGDTIKAKGIIIDAIPAYNIVNPRHVKGVGNGYVITFDNKRVYVAGDTENIPEMQLLHDIDIAFVGFSKYNMDVAMFFDAMTLIKPAVVIPYHYDNADISSLIDTINTIQGVIMLTDTPTTSVTILKKKAPFCVHPNPAKTMLCSDMFGLNSTYTLYNSRGEQVRSSKIVSEGVIDIQDLTPGIYLLSAYNKGNIGSIKFTVSR